MIIHRMQASFGCLDGAELTLDPGFNLITAPNESGKSTWCAFLLAMLYGLNTRARDKKGAPAEKTRYRPWNGKPMEGLLDCDYEGARILLRRSSGKGGPMSSFSAVFADSGEPVPGMTGETAGELLTGVGREVFERSALFRQTALAVEESSELEARIAALLSSGDEQISWSDADARLREWQRARRYHKSGRLPQLEEEEALLLARSRQLQSLWAERQDTEDDIKREEARLAEAEADAKQQAAARRAQLEARRHTTEEDLRHVLSRLQDLSAQAPAPPHEDAEQEAAPAGARHRHKIKLIFITCLSLLLGIALVLAAVFDLLPLPLSLTLLGLLIASYLAFSLHMRHEEQQQNARQAAQRAQQAQAAAAYERHLLTQSNLQERARNARQVLNLLNDELQNTEHSAPTAALLRGQAQLSQKQQRLSLIQGRLQELGDPVELEAQLLENRSMQDQQRHSYDALTIAIETLKGAEQQLRARFSPSLNARAGEYFAQLTNGAYEGLLFSRDFSAEAAERGGLALRPSLLLSRGTLDQLYFALRLAICELILPQPQAVPLILDDALAAFDDQRAALALDLLRRLGKQRQVLFFSCQERERHILAKDAETAQHSTLSIKH